MYDAQNQLVGFDVDVANKLASMLGVKVSFVIVDPNSRIPFLTSGRIDMVMGDTATTPNQGAPYGSRTISGMGPQLRQAAAEARQALLGLASRTLNAPIDVLSVKNGVVSTPGGASGCMRSASFGRSPIHTPTGTQSRVARVISTMTRASVIRP